VFFDPDLRDETTLDDAGEVLARLQSAGVPDAATLDAGDRFMLQDYYAEVSELDIRRQFGSGFAESVMQLEPRRWHGPVLSGYGVHLVYVYDYFAAPAPVFEDVQARVLEDWHTQKREEFNTEFLESLKDRYEIVIEELPADRLLDAQIEATKEKAAEEAAKAESVVEADTSS